MPLVNYSLVSTAGTLVIASTVATAKNQEVLELNQSYLGVSAHSRLEAQLNTSISYL